MFDFLESGSTRVGIGDGGAGHGGKTMVLDKGLGLSALDDLLQVASRYMAVIKLGWGTSVTYDEALLRDKLQRIRDAGVHVCPGGTLMELAYGKDAVEPCLRDLAALGFSAVEVSDGTVEMPLDAKLDLIRRAVDAGFVTLSEVGKKTSEEDQRMRLAERVEHIQRELEAGSWKVILEARESGSLGIFDARGEVKETFVDELVREVDIDKVLFEAPKKNQQLWLIRRFGPGVHLGNIAPEDVISVETLRRGLRADTAKDFQLREAEVRIELGVAGAIAGAERGDVVVVVDCLRASSTIVTALSSGLEAVVPCASMEDGLRAGRISAGERGGRKIPGFTHGNSPIEIRDRGYSGGTLHLSTTNGTECLNCAARGASAVLVGCLLNARAVAEVALELARETSSQITLVTAGRHNREAAEDSIGATEIAHYLDQGQPRGAVAPHYSEDYVADFMASGTGQNLIGLGYSADVVFCAQKDKYDLVPIYREGKLVPYR